MMFVVYKDTENDLIIGMEQTEFLEKKIYRKYKGIEFVEVPSWEDFKKYMIVVYGRVNTAVIKDGNMEFLYDIKPDMIVEGTIQVPVWQIGDLWVVPVCGEKFLSFRIDIGDAEEVMKFMVIEALKKNRFGEITNMEVKKP